MRVVLFGGLTAALISLLIAAVHVVAARPPATVAAVEGPPDPPPPKVQRSGGSRRALPSVVAAPCNPRPGWACWHGRLSLSPAVHSAWLAARAARHAVAEMETEGVDGTDSDDEPRDDESTVVVDGFGSSSDPAEDNSEAAVAELTVPPDASFSSFFDLRLIPRDDADGADQAIIAAFSDGTFEAQLPPGRYDLEAVSRDELLIGAVDALTAIAGAAEGEVEIRLEVAVAIEGRVVDENGVPAPVIVSATRKDGLAGAMISVGSDGRFRFEGLRPGPLRLSAPTGQGDEVVEVEVVAPVRGIELRIPSATDGMLLFPRASDGTCPRGVLTLTSGMGNVRSARHMTFDGCSVMVSDVAPGSVWNLSGKVQGRALERQIRFDTNRPPTPVCLDFPCDPFVAAVDVWIFDARGQRVFGTSRVLSTPYGGPAVGTEMGDVIHGLPGAGSLTLSATVGDREASTTVSLRPGVNRAVIRLPKRP